MSMEYEYENITSKLIKEIRFPILYNNFLNKIVAHKKDAAKFFI